MGKASERVKTMLGRLTGTLKKDGDVKETEPTITEQLKPLEEFRKHAEILGHHYFSEAKFHFEQDVKELIAQVVWRYQRNESFQKDLEQFQKDISQAQNHWKIFRVLDKLQLEDLDKQLALLLCCRKRFIESGDGYSEQCGFIDQCLQFLYEQEGRSSSVIFDLIDDWSTFAVACAEEQEGTNREVRLCDLEEELTELANNMEMKYLAFDFHHHYAESATRCPSYDTVRWEKSSEVRLGNLAQRKASTAEKRKVFSKTNAKIEELLTELKALDSFEIHYCAEQDVKVFSEHLDAAIEKIHEVIGTLKVGLGKEPHPQGQHSILLEYSCWERFVNCILSFIKALICCVESHQTSKTRAEVLLDKLKERKENLTDVKTRFFEPYRESLPKKQGLIEGLKETISLIPDGYSNS